MNGMITMALLLSLALGAALLGTPSIRVEAAPTELRIGAAAIPITPFGSNRDWDGTVTPSGVWGERFTDNNGNKRWDEGEPFEDDPGNDALDGSSRNKYDGIFLAGFGDNRIATGKYDDYWARALILESGQTRIAIVAIDVIGYTSQSTYFGLERVQALVPADLGIDEILITSTHNHEAPDTIGPWGVSSFSDGKYPKYLRFVDRQIAKAIGQAARATAPAKVKLGRTDPSLSPSLAGMQTRTHGRPPDFFDDELRVMQFVGTRGLMRNRTIATLINWNTHPESMESANTLMTSDFPHAVRESIEKRYGGTAVYVSGAIGAAEIIGDSNNDATDRIRFNGKDFPLKDNSKRPAFTIERTYAIGRDVAKAVVEALERGEWSDVPAIDVRKAELRVPMDNKGYVLLAQKGVLDIPPAGLSEVRTWVYVITMGEAQMITTPGELFPEVFYGVEKYRRRDCPAADTGRPPEPSVRDRMTGRYKFVIGLCPDELGYIVPGYDFLAPTFGFNGLKQAADPCKAAGVPSHYHETNSASSQLAPVWACIASTLLQGRVPDAEACRKK